MTKYFKLLGVALIAMSMALVSCEEPTEGNDPGTENPGPNPPDDPGTGGGGTPEVAAGTMAITFGDTVWTSALAEGIDYSGMGLGLNAYSDTEGQTLPMVQSAMNASGVGTYTDAVNGQLQYETVAWLEYWRATVWKIGDSYYGDWWAKEATINVTALDLTAMKVSANINATMFLFADIVVDTQIDPTLIPNAETRNMTVTAVDVEMASAKSGARK